MLSAALAALGLTSLVLAQGSVGGDQSDCSPSQSFVYAGCYGDDQNGRHAGFNWQFSSSATDVKTYPGWNGSMTAAYCTRVCRGHGFKAAAVYGNECYCSPIFPLPTITGSTSSGPGTPVGKAPGTTTSAAACASPCPGDSSQQCAGGGAAAVYYDPSFTSDTRRAGSANNYQYFGCYNNQNPGPMFVSSLSTANTVSCLAYCGLLGYSFSSRSGTDSDTGSTCGCGSEIQSGLQLPESSCNLYCNGTTNAQ